MPKDTKILVVSRLKTQESLFLRRDLILITTANYEEAIKLITHHEFDHVITDAVLSESISGLAILRAITAIKKKPRTIVCHTDLNCQAEGRNWNICVSLGSWFPFAYFYQGTISDYLKQLSGQSKQCA